MVTSNNDTLQQQETNKENLQEVEVHDFTNTPAQNLRMANATATQKEKSMATPTGGVPDLAQMLTGDNTVTQAKELLPP